MGILIVSPELIAANAKDQFVGYAYDLDSGELQYLERHHRVFDGDNLTQMKSTYVDPQEQVIAQRSVQYQDDKVVRFELTDSVNNRAASAVLDDGAVVVERREQDTEKEPVVLPQKTTESVIDAGFNNYVRRNWQPLLAGEVLKFYFLSTERASWVKIQLKYQGSVTEDGQEVAQFKMTAANPVIRMLMTPIKIDYYADTKELYRYQGISNLKQENGKNYRVRIEFPRSDYSGLVALEEKLGTER